MNRQPPVSGISTSPAKSMSLRAALAVAMWLASPALCTAGDIGDKPVGPRISITKDRILVFTDTAARQASVAYPTAASTNPAADDFLRTPPIDYDGYAIFTTTDTMFEDSGYVTGYAGIGAVRLPDAGTITVAYVRLDSHDGISNQDDHYDLRSNDVFIGYSQKIFDNIAIGGEIQLTNSVLEIESTPGFPLSTASDTNGAGFDIGVMAALTDTLTFGLHGGMTWNHNDTEGVASLPGPPAGPGPLPVDVTDTALLTDLRTGLGWRPVEHFGVYADGQWVHYDDDSATIDIGRFYLGGELFLSKHLALRVGTVADTLPQIGVSAGLGYYGFPKMPIELGYAYNTFPEVRKEFGRAHLFSLSLVLLF